MKMKTLSQLKLWSSKSDFLEIVVQYWMPDSPKGGGAQLNITSSEIAKQILFLASTSMRAKDNIKQWFYKVLFLSLQVSLFKT